MRRFVLLSLLVVIAAACASAAKSGRPEGMPQPQMEIRQLGGAPFFGSGYTAPMNFSVYVSNPGNVPLTVRRVEIASIGTATYAIRNAERLFNTEIAPGQSAEFTMSTTAYTNVSRLDVVEPISIRTIVEFEHSGGSRFREVYLARSLN